MMVMLWCGVLLSFTMVDLCFHLVPRKDLTCPEVGICCKNAVVAACYSSKTKVNMMFIIRIISNDSIVCHSRGPFFSSHVQDVVPHQLSCEKTGLLPDLRSPTLCNTEGD